MVAGTFKRSSILHWDMQTFNLKNPTNQHTFKKELRKNIQTNSKGKDEGDAILHY